MKEDKGVKVDAELRSTVSNIFAAGDVVSKPMLETTAAREGYVAAENALANRGLKMDYRAVPHAVFPTPLSPLLGQPTHRRMRKAGSVVRAIQSFWSKSPSL